jgi:hypothetical protein
MHHLVDVGVSAYGKFSALGTSAGIDLDLNPQMFQEACSLQLRAIATRHGFRALCYRCARFLFQRALPSPSSPPLPPPSFLPYTFPFMTPLVS